MKIHELADVEPGAVVGSGTSVWRWTCIRGGAVVGTDCNIGQCVYIDRGVVVGNKCKIQNGCNLYEGVLLFDGVFVGPSVTFTNVKYPRARQPVEGRAQTVVMEDATIGANATILCGVVIGAGAMVAAGAMVTKDVPPGMLVAGNPASVRGKARREGSAF